MLSLQWQKQYQNEKNANEIKHASPHWLIKCCHKDDGLQKCSVSANVTICLTKERSNFWKEAVSVFFYCRPDFTALKEPATTIRVLSSLRYKPVGMSSRLLTAEK